MRRATIALGIGFVLLGGGVALASASLHLSRSSVPAGGSLRISGSAGGCPTGDRLTLISTAFSHAHEFAGVPAIYAGVRSNGRFSRSVRIPSGRRPGRYAITARCGGGNLGVRAVLRVRPVARAMPY